MEIFLDHVRCFSAPRYVPIRPLTLLVGENSSGKSTFLAATACVLDQLRFPTAPGFNDPPYSLGTFETIATIAPGKRKSASTFTIGFRQAQHEDGTKTHKREALATYESRRGAPALQRRVVSTSKGELDVELSDSKIGGRLTLAALGRRPKVDWQQTFEFGLNIGGTGPESPRRFWYSILGAAYQELHAHALKVNSDSDQSIARKAAVYEQSAVNFLNEIEESLAPTDNLATSIAPIRSKPRRTYDDLSESFSPEGNHIPRYLARLFSSESGLEVQETERVRTAIKRFGEESGMFQDVTIKKLGAGSGDPFQIQVIVNGAPTNLNDVGYGVSQVLPTIVESELTSPKTLRLMQQPEVHLHPRAQAALGSLFARLAADGDRGFVIETHSDYLLDRVRQEVASGVISADRVAILFFDKPQLETAVHLIELDELGNVVEPPPRYREFFLEEGLNLLRRGS
jgi:hypothetical protein